MSIRVINCRVMVGSDDEDWVAIVVGFEGKQVVTKRIYRKDFLYDVVKGRFFTDLVIPEEEQ